MTHRLRSPEVRAAQSGALWERLGTPSRLDSRWEMATGFARECQQGLRQRFPGDSRPPRHQRRGVPRPRRSSGCGKSTALRMIAGLEQITSVRCASATEWSTRSNRRIATSRWCSRTTRVSAHDRLRQHWFCSQIGQGAERGDRAAGSARRRNPRVDHLSRSQAWTALGRSASACRYGSRDRPPAGRLPRTSRSPTSTRNSACRCAPKSRPSSATLA